METGGYSFVMETTEPKYFWLKHADTIILTN